MAKSKLGLKNDFFNLGSPILCAFLIATVPSARQAHFIFLFRTLLIISGEWNKL